jgi:hypothetical protein
MKTPATSGIVLAAASLFGTAALAHHSFSAEFDSDQPVKMTGVVTNIQWTNPHVWFYIAVRNEETGDEENWGAEMGPPHGLQRRGWRRDTLKIGEEVTVDGFLARNGSNRMNARTVTLTATGGEPGEMLDAASSRQGAEE